MAMRFNHSERINKYHSYAALGSVQEHPQGILPKQQQDQIREGRHRSRRSYTGT